MFILTENSKNRSNKPLISQDFNRIFIVNKSLDKNKFKNDFEVLSVLRNFKIIGIFSRLSRRDGKHKYLKLIPYAWKLIENRINNNRKFNELKIIIDKNFPKKIRNYEN